MDRIAAMTAFVRVVEGAHLSPSAADIARPPPQSLTVTARADPEPRGGPEDSAAAPDDPFGDGDAGRRDYYVCFYRPARSRNQADIESSAKQLVGFALRARKGRNGCRAGRAGRRARLMGEFSPQLPAGWRSSSAPATDIDLVGRGHRRRRSAWAASHRINSWCSAPRREAVSTTPARRPNSWPRTARRRLRRTFYALPTIGLRSSRAGRPLPFRFSRDKENVELSLVHRLVVNDTNSYVAAGMAGLGIIQAPTYGVHTALSDGGLVALFQRKWHPEGIPHATRSIRQTATSAPRCASSSIGSSRCSSVTNFSSARTSFASPLARRGGIVVVKHIPNPGMDFAQVRTCLQSDRGKPS